MGAEQVEALRFVSESLASLLHAVYLDKRDAEAWLLSPIAQLVRAPH